ncbi:hypothetical protein [Mangrovibrevibacter kandeliae]|uniref:hypothetical protein n=1 Tax=Mangrovibrevibacter kandeliae TaxID=2968473 RepID=UPI0021190EA7|nr:hypothetical protein [Aurantimonas sp. CSK15Z-1]
MTGRELSQALNRVQLSVRQFSRLTGSQPRTIEKWLDDPTAQTPHWVRVLLALLAQPANMEVARHISDAALIEEEDRGDTPHTVGI